MPKILTKREVQFLSYVAAGMKDKQIADEMHISLTTVYCYTRGVYNKMFDAVSSSRLSGNLRCTIVAAAIKQGYLYINPAREIAINPMFETAEGEVARGQMQELVCSSV